MANELRRTILTRDSDFTTPRILALTMHGVLYIAFQPSKDEVLELAKKIAALAKQLEPRPGLLVMVRREYIEVYRP